MGSRIDSLRRDLRARVRGVAQQIGVQPSVPRWRKAVVVSLQGSTVTIAFGDGVPIANVARLVSVSVSDVVLVLQDPPVATIIGVIQ